MTILKVDDETFSIIMLALNECGYDLDGLEIDFYDEIVREDDDEIPKSNLKNSKKKLKLERKKLKSSTH